MTTKTSTIGIGELTQTFHKKYGAGSIVPLKDNRNSAITHHTSTGIYELDDATSWGIPGKRIIEFFGPESSGKTTALMMTMIENARHGGINFVVDGEGTFDSDRYRQMGGDPEQLHIIAVDTLEEFYERALLVAEWAKKRTMPPNALILMGIDSLPSLIPKAELEADTDDQLVGVASRCNTRNLPKLAQAVPDHMSVIIINQVRDKIGAMAFTEEGNIDTPGGRAVKHWCSVRIMFKKAGQIDNNKKDKERRIIGMKTEAKVVKNKVGPPLRKIMFRIMFDHRGIDMVFNFLQVLKEKKLVSGGTGGIYKIKDKSITVETLPIFMAKNPNWTKAALARCYDVEHTDINITRYLEALRRAKKEQAEE